MTATTAPSPSRSSKNEPRKSAGLTTWILASLVAGIVVGLGLSFIAPAGSAVNNILVENVFYVLGQWFIRLMQMIVVPLVFCSIVCGAASMSNPKLLGKVGAGTIVMYLCTTALAVIIAIALAQVMQPGVGLDMASIVRVDPTATTTDQTIAQMLINIVPTNIVAAMNGGTMLQIIFFALVLGFILGRLGSKVATVNRFFTQFNAVMMYMIGLILKVAPIGIFCLIARTFCNLGLDGIMPMVKFIATVYLGLFIQLLVVYMLLLFLFTRLNPFHFLKKMVPVMLFAFSTSSSNATIPLNMDTLEKKVGVDQRITSVTIPLGATIYMDGTAIMQAMVFESVGLPAEGVAMIMGVDRILDMGRTAINVTGDAVVTTCIGKLAGMLNVSVFKGDEPLSLTEIEDEIAHAGEGDGGEMPVGYSDFTAHGEPTEIGESGNPDKYADLDIPR